MQQAFRIQVESYAGHKADERPKAVIWKGRRIELREILDRWYGEHADFFKALGDDGTTYILRHLRGEDVWELAMATRGPQRRGTSCDGGLPGAQPRRRGRAS